MPTREPKESYRGRIVVTSILLVGPLLLVGLIFFSLTRTQPLVSTATPAAAPTPDRSLSFVDQGRQLYDMYCVACHGKGARGGIANPNYYNDVTPGLNTLAEKLRIDEPEDAATISKLLEEGTPLQTHAANPPFRGYRIFMAQHAAIQKLVAKGNKAGKKDPKGPEPLSMPPWEQVLKPRQVDSIIVYLVGLYPWDEEEG